MPPITFPNTARAVQQYTQHGQQRVNVLHYLKPAGSITQADLDALAGHLVTQWTNLGRPACSNQLTMEQVQVTDVSPGGGLQSTVDLNPPSAGTVPDPPAPGNVTHTASFRTPLTGRKYRGRVFLPGMTDTMTNDIDTVTSGRLIAAAAWVAQWMFNLPSGWVLGVASQVTGVTTPVATIVFENILDSMRRRLPGRGR